MRIFSSLLTALLIAAVAASCKGELGTQGVSGPQGQTGTAGQQGQTGPAGPTGSTGATGAKGAANGGIYTSADQVYCVRNTNGLFHADGGMTFSVGSFSVACKDPRDLPLTGSCAAGETSNPFPDNANGSIAIIDSQGLNPSADFFSSNWACSFRVSPSTSRDDLPRASAEICCILNH